MLRKIFQHPPPQKPITFPQLFDQPVRCLKETRSKMIRHTNATVIAETSFNCTANTFFKLQPNINLKQVSKIAIPPDVRPHVSVTTDFEFPPMRAVATEPLNDFLEDRCNNSIGYAVGVLEFIVAVYFTYTY